MKLQNHSLKMILDTGSKETVLYSTLPAERITPWQLIHYGEILKHAAGSILTDRIRLSNLHFAGHQWKTIEALLLNSMHPQVDGILGLGGLNIKEITFSPGGQLVQVDR